MRGRGRGSGGAIIILFNCHALDLFPQSLPLTFGSFLLMLMLTQRKKWEFVGERVVPRWAVQGKENLEDEVEQANLVVLAGSSYF